MADEIMEDLIEKLRGALDEIYRLDSQWKKRGGWAQGERGTILYPPASAFEIKAFEKKIKKTFPPSYRRFLGLHNGWKHFWLDFTLIGVSGDHTKRALNKITEDEAWQANYLECDLALGELTPKRLKAWEAHSETNLLLSNHFPFGTSFGGEIYVFDARTKKRNGEMEIVYWTIDYGVWEEYRYADFTDLLKRTLQDAQKHLSTLKRKKKRR